MRRTNYWFGWAKARVEQRAFRRGLLALSLACMLALVGTVIVAHQRTERTTARLEDAAEQLDSLWDSRSLDDARRGAIAWGYAERLRLGLESPFRLIETAASDTRLSEVERRTVSWALLAHVLRGESHDVDPATLDVIGPSEHGRSVPGEDHLELITNAIVGAENPRAAELAVRFAYALAHAERIVDAGASTLAAEVAALVADRELARREAMDIVRTATADPIEEVRRRRQALRFYVERPVLLAPERDIERGAVELTAPLLAGIRALSVVQTTADSLPTRGDVRLAADLRIAGEQLPPSSALAVTVQRYLPMLRHAAGVDLSAMRSAWNTETLVAATHLESPSRATRRLIGRLRVAVAVAMRTVAQDPIVFAVDTAATPSTVATTLGLASVAFDRDVPTSWRPFFLRSLVDAIGDLRRVLPAFDLRAVNVRFRMTAPADSALAMHDPRTRTLHLPTITAGGTLLHELAHELDRQSAVHAGLPGYRSDAEVRTDLRKGARASGANGGRVAASLRALTEEITDFPLAAKAAAERPAEIFATRVDWFVSQALARLGVSSGFLSGVQDELLTGHVVHPERLSTAGRSRSLLDALEGMTSVAAGARALHEPSIQTVLRWSLTAPVDRGVAATIVRGRDAAWETGPLVVAGMCDDRGDEGDRRVALMRLAAESRARGWLRQRARWIPEAERPVWARSALRQAPWTADAAEQRVAELSDHVLVQLASGDELPAGLSAYAAALATRARCN